MGIGDDAKQGCFTVGTEQSILTPSIQTPLYSNFVGPTNNIRTVHLAGLAIKNMYWLDQISMDMSTSCIFHKQVIRSNFEMCLPFIFNITKCKLFRCLSTSDQTGLLQACYSTLVLRADGSDNRCLSRGKKKINMLLPLFHEHFQERDLQYLPS